MAPPADHPAGVAGRQREHVVLAAFDAVSDPRDILATWASRAGDDLAIGVGPSLFDARFGLEDLRPARLRRLPAFPGDALEPARSDGDLVVAAFADEPDVAAAAVDALAAEAGATVAPRWRQPGFLRPGHGTRRNLLGFKDGSMNPRRPGDLDRHVWVRSGDLTWMLGGTYLVYRRIRFDLAGWAALGEAEQERIMGRHKRSGAPLGQRREFDPRRLEELPADSHVRMSAARSNGGAAMLRRGYSYADAGRHDAGLLFLAYQQDPRRQFVPVQARLARDDALSAYVTHTGSAVFALPPSRSLVSLRGGESTRASPRRSPPPR